MASRTRAILAASLGVLTSGVTFASLARIQTNAGNIDIEFFDAQAPLTVANFKNYIAQGKYASNIFHRLVPGFVLQGGGFGWSGGGAFGPVVQNAPVLNEPGISNTVGTLAMAKLGGDPNSATSQWFINLADNSGNLDAQNGGFTVFARVIAGWSVVQTIAGLNTYDLGGAPLDEVPLYQSGTNYYYITTSTAEVSAPSIVNAWVGSGSYGIASGWTGSAVPSGTNATARFGGGGATNVTLASPTTLAILYMDSPVTYQLAGAAITIEGNAGSTGILASGAAQVVSNPLTLNGSVILDNRSGLRLGSVTLGPGAIATLSEGAGPALVVSSLTLDGAPGAWNSRVQLNDRSVVVDYDGPTPLQTLTSQIASAFGAGQDWSGPGIGTTLGGGGYSVGIAEAADIFGMSAADTAVWGDVTVDASSVLIAFTYQGDTDLNGTVDLDDLFRLVDGYNAYVSSGTASWAAGDLDYNGTVDLDDLFILVDGYNVAAGLSPTSVPEPVAAIPLAALVLGLSRRRRS